MSTVTTLIQPKEIVNAGIVKASPLNARFDASIIAPVIHLAEDRFLKTFICSEFYEDLISQKNPIPSNYNDKLGPIVQAYPSNADYEFLWTEYLLAYLSRCSYYMALPDIAVQTGSNGLFVNNTEFGQNIGVDGIKFKRDIELQNIEGRKPIILKYLCDNSEKYPLFNTEGICKECCHDCKEGNCNKHSVLQNGRDLGIIIY